MMDFILLSAMILLILSSAIRLHLAFRHFSSSSMVSLYKLHAKKSGTANDGWYSGHGRPHGPANEADDMGTKRCCEMSISAWYGERIY